MGYKVKKDIDPHNDLGQWHGYQEWYFDDFWFRGCYKHGENIGYQEEHSLGTNTILSLGYNSFSNFYIK
jgi:hypothetical protein